MDQTKFINSYINNLAEQLKAITLDNIMVKTQLNLANEAVAELTAKIQELEEAANLASTTPEKKAKESDWKESNFTKDGQDQRMSTVVQIKRNEVAGVAPVGADLAVGELAVNLTDKKIFSKKTDGTVVSLGGVEVNDGGAATSVATISFADTIFGDFAVDTTTTPGVAVVRLNQNADLDYGLITDNVLAYNSIDYGSI